MSRMEPNSVLIVGGPTASGKSGLALDLAENFDGEIINADSMQVYKDTPVLAACPTLADMEKVPHHLYQIYDASVNGTVVDWLDKAVQKIKDIWGRNKIPVVVGGTGLYLDNLLHGTTPIPEADAKIREKVRMMQQEIGTPKLHEMLQKVDAVTAQRLSPNDTTRVTRAYEVWLQTGEPLSLWHQKPMIKKLSDALFKIVKIYPSTEELDERCFVRFDKMMDDGALDEVRRLYARNLPQNLPAMKALGVPELGMYVKGECSLEEAIKLGKLHTRQYAKRQRTWFGNRLEADIILSCCYGGDFNFSLLDEIKSKK